MARALQEVEAAVGLPVTSLDLPESPPGVLDGPPAHRPYPQTAAAAASAPLASRAPVYDDATRLRPAVVVSPEAPRGRAGTAAGPPAASATPAAVSAPAARPSVPVSTAAPAPPAVRQQEQEPDDDRTRVRGVRTVDPERVAPEPASATPATPTASTASTTPVVAAAAQDPRPGRTDQADDAVAHLWPRSTGPTPSRRDDAAARSRSRGGLWAVVGSVVVIAAVVVGLVTAGRSGREDPPGDAQSTGAGPSSTAGGLATVPAPTDVTLTAQDDGSVLVTWSNPEPLDGDRYTWGVLGTTGETALEVVDAPPVSVPASSVEQADGTLCVQVAIVRADRRSSTQPATGCLP